MRVKKRSITLLEVVISIVLLGILLTGLFNVFRQSLKTSINAKALKQKILHLELFQQRLKTLFITQSAAWIDTHEEATGPALFFNYEQDVNPDFELQGDLQGILFLNRQKELCLQMGTKDGKQNVETLLDNVSTFSCLLFDPKTKQWSGKFSKEQKEIPVMASIKLKINNQEVPFVFFLRANPEQITYKDNS